MQWTPGKNCLSLLQLRNRKICINSALSYQHWTSNQCWFHVSPHRISQAIPLTLTFYCRIKQQWIGCYKKFTNVPLFILCSVLGIWSGTRVRANQEEKDHLVFCNLWNAWSNLWRRSREAINDGTLIQSLTLQQQQNLTENQNLKSQKSCALIATLSWYLIPPPSPEALPLEARTWGRCTYWCLKNKKTS